MRIAREEIFGPVAAVIPFKDENDAVFQGNDTTYGLAAAVCARCEPRFSSGARDQSRHGLGQLLQQHRSDFTVRRLQAIWYRSRARQAFARSLYADQIGICETLILDFS